MYIGYGALMLLRQIITILGPALLADESLGLTKTNLGDFGAYGTIGALVGKIIWGPLTDKIGGRLTFIIGIAVTAIFVFAFGLSSNLIAFTSFSVIIYCIKSAGWPALTKLIGNWYHPQSYGRTWAILSTSSRASVVLATLFFGWLLGHMAWQYVAFTAAAIGILITVYCYFFMSEAPENSNFIEENAPKDLNDPQKIKETSEALENLRNHPLKETTLMGALIYFLKSHRVWLVSIMMMMLTCLMAFLDFTSVYLMEVFKLTPSNAAMASSVFPLGSLGGLVLSVAFYDRFSKKGISLVLTGSLVLSCVCILILKFLPGLGLSESANFQIALISIAVFGLCISPAYYIPMSVFSIGYGGPHSATLICILDAFGFAASAAFGFVGGRLADSSGGWDSFMNMILALVALSTVFVFAFMFGEYKASRNK